MGGAWVGPRLSFKVNWRRAGATSKSLLEERAPRSSAFRTRSPKLSSVRYVAGNRQGGGAAVSLL